MNSNYKYDFKQLALEIKQLGKELGFDQIGITNTDITQEVVHLKTWVKSGRHGNMSYFEKHSEIYECPQKLLPTTTRVICCRINYPLSQSSSHPIASFAQIQDYSSHIRQLLKIYVAKILEKIRLPQETRVFSGNAPILEKALAAKAGLGWYGKNSILINQDSGSYFFLGEIFTNMPLPLDKPVEDRCGSCFKCGDSCPTKAIITPHKLDARCCVAYLTIEHKGSIPIELRPLIGTKVFGCDICQQACPWNNCRKNQTPPNTTFVLSNHLGSDNLVDWFLWSEQEFLDKTKNTPIKRIGYERWLRNLAVALGNSEPNKEISEALQSRLNHPSALVREHVEWALASTQ
ncbi:MAG TPA: tRNA epoxyqueuosine(34) reductase QueG [Coxiellaceae bacterium]|nr:MAG: tRNA epoxyqueuosine(34) reductase QueG [Gammaproteobacteria bacterium RBG_16_37_9]HBC71343.1 tRNA epoxyqueuosine(34) reductase QueG [Coxiellaceae bacterium]